MALVPPPGRRVFEALRAGVLALGGVRERIVYDTFAQEWVPAYLAKGGQLFHVHFERGTVRPTITLSRGALAEAVRVAPFLSPALKGRVARAPAYGGHLWASVPLGSAAEVRDFLGLVELKRAHQTARARHALQDGRG